MMLLNYVSKKQLKGAVGERLSYIETSLFGDEYKSTGCFGKVMKAIILKRVIL